jgi:RNA polymerase sigma-70 factor (ECF subfamily)
LVLLEFQDRARWDDRLIALGFHHFDLSMSGDEVTEYHAQAAIAATYARAQDPHSVDWQLILTFYDQLLSLNPSSVVALNRTVVVAKVHGPAQALTLLRPLADDPKLQGYYLLSAVRGNLLLEMGEFSEAARCFEAALKCSCSEPERRFLQRKLDSSTAT